MSHCIWTLKLAGCMYFTLSIIPYYCYIEILWGMFSIDFLIILFSHSSCISHPPNKKLYRFVDCLHFSGSLFVSFFSFHTHDAIQEEVKILSLTSILLHRKATFLYIRASRETANSDHCLITSNLRIVATPRKLHRLISRLRLGQQYKGSGFISENKYQCLEMFEK